MQKNYVNSRSVVVNRYYRKSIEDDYDHHKKRLDSIKNRKSQFEAYDQIHSEYIKTKLQQKSKVQKVKAQLNPQQNQVKSLVGHITEIVQRKGNSSIIPPEKSSRSKGVSLTEYRKNHNKNIQNERREIYRQNQILTKKIKEHQNNILTKKELKKQFKVYESHRNLLRKVHYDQKPKKKKQKSMDSLDRHHDQ